MPDPDTILNWRRWNPSVTMSGQPTAQQFQIINDLGVTTVINLGPHDDKNAVPDEPATVAALGMTYVYIPVDFAAPTIRDFNQFCAALAAAEGQQVHVHCLYNARVSAFFYRYAKEGRGGSIDQAFQLMGSIWRPGGVWADFIGDAASAGLPNRYKGYDYDD